MGQTIEGHHEDFTRRCKLERNSWGVQAHWHATNFLRFLAEVDQCDICNLVSAEAMFREIQTIEYSYQDKMRDLEGGSGGGGGGAGRLTSEEQAMFAGTARLSSTLMFLKPQLFEEYLSPSKKPLGARTSTGKASFDQISWPPSSAPWTALTAASRSA